MFSVLMHYVMAFAPFPTLLTLILKMCARHYLDFYWQKNACKTRLNQNKINQKKMRHWMSDQNLQFNQNAKKISSTIKNQSNSKKIDFFSRYKRLNEHENNWVAFPSLWYEYYFVIIWLYEHEHVLFWWFFVRITNTKVCTMLSGIHILLSTNVDY